MRDEQFGTDFEFQLRPKDEWADSRENVAGGFDLGAKRKGRPRNGADPLGLDGGVAVQFAPLMAATASSVVMTSFAMKRKLTSAAA